MDFVEIWIDGPIPVDRDEVEDALNEALTSNGEVTGAGTSERGVNLDVEVEESTAEDVVLGRIFAVLEDLSVGDSAKVRPGDGEVWIRLSEWSGLPGR